MFDIFKTREKVEELDKLVTVLADELSKKGNAEAVNMAINSANTANGIATSLVDEVCSLEENVEAINNSLKTLQSAVLGIQKYIIANQEEKEKADSQYYHNEPGVEVEIDEPQEPSTDNGGDIVIDGDFVEADYE